MVYVDERMNGALAGAEGEDAAGGSRGPSGARIAVLDDVVSFFDGLASSWDERCEHDSVRLRRVLDETGVGEGSRVLDIACGTGVLVPWYLELGAGSVVGIDCSSRMIGCARAKGFGPRVSFEVGDACSMDLPACDRAVVFNAIPHFAHPGALFRNVSRCLEEGGRLTVAHDASRRVIDGGHSGSASRISRGLPAAADMASLMEPWFSVDTVIDREIYVVSGIVRG